MFDQKTYAKRLLMGLIKLSGDVDSVARRLIELAKLEGGDKTVECDYGGIILHVRSDSTIDIVRKQYEQACYEGRLWPRLVAHSVCTDSPRVA